MTTTRGPVDDRKIPALLSVTEVAEILSVSRTAVKAMIAEGRLPARKVGTTYVIREATLTAMEVSL